MSPSVNAVAVSVVAAFADLSTAAETVAPVVVFHGLVETPAGRRPHLASNVVNICKEYSFGGEEEKNAWRSLAAAMACMCRQPVS